MLICVMGLRKVFDLFCPLCVVRHLSLSLPCSVPLLSTGFVSGFYCCVFIGLGMFVAFFSNGILSCFSLSLILHHGYSVRLGIYLTVYSNAQS